MPSTDNSPVVVYRTPTSVSSTGLTIKTLTGTVKEIAKGVDRPEVLDEALLQFIRSNVMFSIPATEYGVHHVLTWGIVIVDMWENFKKRMVTVSFDTQLKYIFGVWIPPGMSESEERYVAYATYHGHPWYQVITLDKMASMLGCVRHQLSQLHTRGYAFGVNDLTEHMISVQGKVHLVGYAFMYRPKTLMTAKKADIRALAVAVHFFYQEQHPNIVDQQSTWAKKTCESGRTHLHPT